MAPGPSRIAARRGALRIAAAGIAIPILAALLRLEAQRRGLLTLEEGLALMTSLTVLLFALATWLGLRSIAPALDRSDQANLELAQQAKALQEAVAQTEAARVQLEHTVQRTDLAERVTGRGTWEWNIQQDRAVWSNGMYQLFGLEPQTFVNSNENFLALVHPDDRQRMGQAIADALATPGHFLQEYRLRRPDGKQIDVRGEGDVVPDASGGPTMVYGVVLDVTEAKEAQRKSQATETQLQAITTTAPDAILVANEDGIILQANAAAARMFGTPVAVLQGRSLTSLMPQRFRAAHEAGMQRYLKTRQPKIVGRVVELAGLRQDGTEFPVELSLGATELDGRMLLTGVLRDITERKEAEVAVQRAQERFQRVFQASPIPISLSQEDGTLLEVNDAFCRLVGHDRQVLLRDIKAPDLYEDPEERQRLLVTLRDHGLVRNQELRIKRTDGAIRTTLASVEFVDMGGGTTILSLLQDITERKEAQDEREARIASEAELDRLRRTDQFRTEFINSTAHELATPLTPLVLNVRTLLHDPALPVSHRRAIESMERNILRLKHLVQDMVGAADLQARTIALDKRRVNLNRELKAAVAAHLAAAERGGLHLADPEDGGETVTADPHRLQLVLSHLLGNAVKFTPPGGRVWIATRRQGDQVRISVNDTGMGLTTKQMEGLWKPFAQAHDKSQRTDSGSGLGLYVTKGIVELHGGEVGCSSPGPGKGATFWFTLPLATGHLDPLAKPSPNEPAPAPRRNLNPGVGDEPA